MAARRRLAVVMITDLCDYTARSHQDETQTLRLLKEHRALVRPILARFEGREVKTLGDGFLVAFDSALNAVQCALELRDRCADWVRESEEDRPRTRIALHMGDVIDEGGDILGDAVNVTSRLESVAEPGGICLSAPVLEQVRGRLSIRTEKLPTPRLKGIATPIEAFRVLGGPAVPAGEGRGAPPARIAVLPFTSISPDPKDEYLADGLTEELITTLSQLGGLRVIARTSVDVYKKHPKPAREIGAELNVRSLLEGSVRRAGSTVRITAQLIDTASQEHLWSQQFDRTVDDVFAIQSEIAALVAHALAIRIREHEEQRLRARPTGVTESYLAYLRGRSLLRSVRLDHLQEAERQFERAMRLDPKNARAYSGLADARYQAAVMFPSDRRHPEILATLRSCQALASNALLLDPSAAESHATLGRLSYDIYEFREADRSLRTAISLNPSYAPAHQYYAWLLADRGRLDDAVAELRLAEEADPLAPRIQFWLVRILSALGRNADAQLAYRKLSELEPEGLRSDILRFELQLPRPEIDALLDSARRICAHASSESRMEQTAYWQGRAYAACGQAAKARAEIAKLTAVHEAGTPGASGWAASQLADLYAELGDLDATFSWLEKGFRARTLAFLYLWVSPTYSAVRGDPRFPRLLERAGLA